MKKSILITGIYSLIHFLVDMSCAALMFNIMFSSTQMNIILEILLYNMFAFAFELPFGIIADKLNKNAMVSAIGCLTIILSLIFLNNPIVSCVIAGIGNALFHVGGGIDVLNISNKKATLPGIYVSTGALGLYLGQKFSKITKIIPVIMVVSAIALIWLYNKIKDEYKINNEIKQNSKVNISKILISIPIIIVICIRGYMGLILNFEWKSNIIFAILSILCVVGGKMLGGIIGDKIGWKKISILSLGLASILFAFSWNSAICGLLAILLFNMTMPITLMVLANMFPNRKGMAFGLTTLGLFIGGLPVILNVNLGLFNIAGVVGLTIFSLLILYFSLKEYEEAI